ncbi:hypothetical protein GH733_013749 [Mirounga leonina]|nr:hypothetical protein GH733_013749 [Mirounga leonina]
MMPKEDSTTWKFNYFLKIIQLLDDDPNAPLWSRQHGFQEDTADLHVPPREDCGAEGKNTMTFKAI